MGQERRSLGRYGEDAAIKFLRKNKYKILERNYKTPLGEIDIIAKKENTTVFVEVKSRSSPLFGPPYLRVTKEKRRNIIKTALSYLKKHGLSDQEARVDVVAVNFDKAGSEVFELIEDAFGIEWWWL